MTGLFFFYCLTSIVRQKPPCDPAHDRKTTWFHYYTRCAHDDARFNISVSHFPGSSLQRACAHAKMVQIGHASNTRVGPQRIIPTPASSSRHDTQACGCVNTVTITIRTVLPKRGASSHKYTFLDEHPNLKLAVKPGGCPGCSKNYTAYMNDSEWWDVWYTPSWLL